MKNLIFALLVLLCAMKTQAAVHTETVEYKQGDTTLEGFLAYDDSISGKRPGVLVVHQWFGLTDYEKRRATSSRNSATSRFARTFTARMRAPKRCERSRRAGGQI
jgi:hypothetical protein